MAPARTAKQMVRDLPSERTMKMRSQPIKTRAELQAELEVRELEFASTTSSVEHKAAPSRSLNTKVDSICSRGERFFRVQNRFGSKVFEEVDDLEGASLPVLSNTNPFPEDEDAVFCDGTKSGNPDPVSLPVGRTTRKNRMGSGIDDVSENDKDSTDSDEESDFEALQLELAKIRREKEEERKKKEEETAREAEMERQTEIGKSNPLLSSNVSTDRSLKRKWHEDTVFKNQARTISEPKRRFINDNMRSDFHKRFLQKYINR